VAYFNVYSFWLNQEIVGYDIVFVTKQIGKHSWQLCVSYIFQSDTKWIIDLLKGSSWGPGKNSSMADRPTDLPEIYIRKINVAAGPGRERRHFRQSNFQNWFYWVDVVVHRRAREINVKEKKSKKEKKVESPSGNPRRRSPVNISCWQLQEFEAF
jgi:hypothetical protein